MRVRRVAALASFAAAVALGSLAVNPAVGVAEAADDAGGNVTVNTEATLNAAAAEAATNVEQPRDAVPATGVGPRATWHCDWWINPSNQFNANCSVSSGSVRLYAQCQDGSWIYSPWVGSGSWYLWVRCGSGLNQYGFQTVG